jgi:hypothetical protein
MDETQAAQQSGSSVLSDAEDLTASPDSHALPPSKRARTQQACSPTSRKELTAYALQSASICTQPAEQPAGMSALPS